MKPVVRPEPTRFESRCEILRREPQAWLVTGAAGFIGSNLCEALLRLDQRVVGLDNLSNGFKHNVEGVRAAVGEARSGRFEFISGDLRSMEECRRAMTGVRYVLHQGALGSVPRSLADPLASRESNVTGFLNVLLAARDLRPERVVYASSSSVYGDSAAMPKVESAAGRALSPYAATKQMDESYADVFARCFAVPTVGLRYFNVFGPRQRPDGPYAAVIPRWIGRMLRGEAVEIYGDGTTRRDFSYVANVVQGNIMAATECRPDAHGSAVNVAYGQATSLNRLYQLLAEGLKRRLPGLRIPQPGYRDFRPGDIRDSLADVSRARAAFGFEPSHDPEAGLDEALDWYVEDFRRAQGEASP